MRRLRDERGAALVEAGFIVPILLMLVLGVVDFGRAFFEAADVQAAAQEGVLFASLNPDDPSGAITRAEEAIQSADFTGQVSVTCPADDQVTVAVTYPFTPVTPFAPATIDLSHSETAHVLSSNACVPGP